MNKKIRQFIFCIMLAIVFLVAILAIVVNVDYESFVCLGVAAFVTLIILLIAATIYDIFFGGPHG